MKRVLGHTLGLMMTVMIALTGCIPESSQAEEFKEGTHYATISPAITDTSTCRESRGHGIVLVRLSALLRLEPTIQKFLSKKAG